MGTPYIPPTFTPPTQEQLTADPGYQSRLKGGVEALNRAAAAKGVLRTGGTLKDILSYGQDLASQESANAYDRYVKQYGLQQQNALDKWKADWEQYQFANMPRGGGGGGGGGDDFIAPPEAPDYGPPDEGDGADYGAAGGDPYGGGGGGGPYKPTGPYGDGGGEYY